MYSVCIMYITNNRKKNIRFIRCNSRLLHCVDTLNLFNCNWNLLSYIHIYIYVYLLYCNWVMNIYIYTTAHLYYGYICIILNIIYYVQCTRTYTQLFTYKIPLYCTPTEIHFILKTCLSFVEDKYIAFFAFVKFLIKT